MMVYVDGTGNSRMVVIIAVEAIERKEESSILCGVLCCVLRCTLIAATLC